MVLNIHVVYIMLVQYKKEEKKNTYHGHCAHLVGFFLCGWTCWGVVGVVLVLVDVVMW